MRSIVVGERETTQGANYLLKVRFWDMPEKIPHNFAGFTGATAFFTGASITTPWGVTGLNPETNMLQFSCQPTDTENILPGDFIDFQVEWQDASGIRIETCSGQVSVNQQLF